MARNSVKLVNSGLDKLVGETRRRAEKLVDKTANNIREAAENMVAVDTGALKKSITVTDDGELTRIVSAGNATVDYAEHVEFGTSKQPAQPFFTPAVEQERPKFEAGVKRLIDG